MTASGSATVKVEKAGIQTATKTIAVIFYKASDENPDENPDETPDENPDETPGDFEYEGTVYLNSNWPAQLKGTKPDQPLGQKIPGMVMCALFDEGGEGVAFHDDEVKYGSDYRAGNIDLKAISQGDDYNHGNPHMVPNDIVQINTPYVGWTGVGEWFRITVEVEKDGVYDVGLLYSSNNRGAKISLAIDGGAPKLIEPTCTKNYHIWNKEVITTLSLEMGVHVLTVKVEAQGEMNLAYLEFTRLLPTPR